MKRLCLCVLLLHTACLSVDLTDRPCPCLDGYVCVDDVCVRSDGNNDQGVCPATFNDADACTAAPPAAATLVAVCAQSDTFEEELFDAAGAAFGTCFGPPLSASLVSESLSGTIAFVDDVLHVRVSGPTTWDVAVPASCVAEFGCQPAQAGSCAAVDGGCACEDMTVTLDVDEELEQASTLWTGSDGTWRGCAEDGVFLLRRQEGSARGLTFVFRAN